MQFNSTIRLTHFDTADGVGGAAPTGSAPETDTHCNAQWHRIEMNFK